jgi:hypothetical protein
MDTIKYKKILFEDLIKRINKTENNKYKSFIELYINNYLSKFKINSLENFIDTNKSQLNFYKKYDLNCQIYFHYLTDKSIDKIIGIEKVIDINDKFFDIKYFKDIQKEFTRDSVIYAINLYVDENYRGKSLCKKLLTKIQSNSKKHNKKYIISEIHNNNIISIKCHESSGFKKTEFLSYPDTYFYINKL